MDQHGCAVLPAYAPEQGWDNLLSYTEHSGCVVDVSTPSASGAKFEMLDTLLIAFPTCVRDHHAALPFINRRAYIHADVNRGVKRILGGARPT